jgi:hypothetical protein
MIDGAWVAGERLRADQEQQFHDREDRDRHDRVGNPVGAKQGDPHAEVVTTEGQRHGEGGQRTATKDFARLLLAISPRVPGERPRRQAQQSHPRQGNRREERTDAAGDDEECRHTQGLGVAHATDAVLLGDDQLCGEREEVVEHRSEERKDGHDDDTENRVHALTLPDGRKARNRAQ